MSVFPLGKSATVVSCMPSESHSLLQNHMDGGKRVRLESPKLKTCGSSRNETWNIGHIHAAVCSLTIMTQFGSNSLLLESFRLLALFNTEHSGALLNNRATKNRIKS